MKLLMDDFFDEYKNEFFYVEGIVLKEYIKNKVFIISEVVEVYYIKDLIFKVLIGLIVFLIDGLVDVFIFGIIKVNKWNIEELVLEVLVRGLWVGFIEVLSDNILFLWRYCVDESLLLVKLLVGECVKKELVVVFIKDFVSIELVDEIKNRI